MSGRLDGDTRLCDEYFDAEGPLVECDLLMDHEGDHHAVVRWPRTNWVKAEPTPMSEAMERIWASTVARMLAPVLRWPEEVQGGRDR